MGNHANGTLRKNQNRMCGGTTSHNKSVSFSPATSKKIVKPMSATVTHDPNQKTLFVLGTCPSAIVGETGFVVATRCQPKQSSNLLSCNSGVKRGHLRGLHSTLSELSFIL